MYFRDQPTAGAATDAAAAEPSHVFAGQVAADQMGDGRG